jgi:hypothetical protein
MIPISWAVRSTKENSLDVSHKEKVATFSRRDPPTSNESTYAGRI